MELSYKELLKSPVFRFLVGPEQEFFDIHAALASHHSNAFDALMNGDGAEAEEAAAELEKTDVKTFVRVAEFMYSGNYQAEAPEVVEQPAPSDGNDGAQADTVAVAEPAFDESSDWGPSMSKKKTKKRLRVENMLEYSNTRPAETTRKSESLWNAFKERSPIPSDHRFTPRRNSTPNEIYTEVFLCHARVYVFADKFFIPRLKELALEKLHQTLLAFTLFTARIGDIVRLLEYTYEKVGHSQTDGLKELVVRYATCKVEKLASNAEFRALLSEDGPLAVDLMDGMLLRLDI